MDSEHFFEDRAYVRKWAETADARRPHRPAMFTYITGLVSALGAPSPRVLELGCGPGTLAAALLGTIADMTYDGIDYSPAMLELAGERLAAFGTRVCLHRADLREDWTALAPSKVDAIVTNQALHDLGSDDAVALTYRRARALLRPDGLFVNAELTVAEDAPAGKPGKMPVSRHLELLEASGFVAVQPGLAFAEYVCLSARAPA